MLSSTRSGTWYAVIAYVLWGFVPIYWKGLQGISALQLICHRIVWSCLVLVVFIARSNDWGTLWTAIRSHRVIGIYAAAAVAVSVNWFIYVWAVTHGFIVETSLGYFINPLFSVLLGVLVFHETLRRWQWGAIGLAAAGVVYLTLFYGSFPWIALGLAASFGSYGLLKKLAPLGSVQGLALETGILFIPAMAFLIYSDMTGTGAFLYEGSTRNLLMVGAGPLTTIPLLFFAAGIRRIPLSSMGMLQYINPTLQFLIGVMVYKEPFPPGLFVGFALVWAALALFAIEEYVTRRWYPVVEVP